MYIIKPLSPTKTKEQLKEEVDNYNSFIKGLKDLFEEHKISLCTDFSYDNEKVKEGFDTWGEEVHFMQDNKKLLTIKEGTNFSSIQDLKNAICYCSDLRVHI